jgi:hypothetical protein
VSPLAVISIGCFSVPAWPNAHEEAQKTAKTGKSSLRIAGCEVTEGTAPCKGKTPLDPIQQLQVKKVAGGQLPQKWKITQL